MPPDIGRIPTLPGFPRLALTDTRASEGDALVLPPSSSERYLEVNVSVVQRNAHSGRGESAHRRTAADRRASEPTGVAVVVNSLPDHFVAKRGGPKTASVSTASQ